MKTHTFVALTLAGALTGATFGAPPSSFAQPAANAAPVPVKIVAPMNLPRSYENARVELVLTIDAAGVPHEISAVGYLPDRVKQQLLPAVAQWRFAPMYQDGHPVSTRVVLPLRLVDGA